jgi:iron(III) transport system substrate-binding protein
MKVSTSTTILRLIVFTFTLLSLPNVAFHVSHHKFSKISFESSMVFAATADTKALDSLYQAAKKDGRAVFWGPTDPDEIAPIIAAFKKQFPGIEVTHFEIQPNEFTQRFAAEGRAGRAPEADILELGPREIAVLRERDLLQRHNDWATLFGLSASEIYGDGIGVSYHDLPHIVAANTNLLKREAYPKTWDDLTDPKWKGKLIVEQRVQAIGGLGLSKGEEWLKKFAAGLKSQNPIYVRGGTTSFNQLLSGQAPLTIGPYLHQVIIAKKKGAPADLVPLSPMLVSPRLVGIHTKAQHPNAGKLFAGWLATPSAQKVIEAASSRSVVNPSSGTQGAELLKKHGIELIIDNDKIARKRVALEELVQEILSVRR